MSVVAAKETTRSQYDLTVERLIRGEPSFTRMADIPPFVRKFLDRFLKLEHVRRYDPHSHFAGIRLGLRGGEGKRHVAFPGTLGEFCRGQCIALPGGFIDDLSHMQHLLHWKLAAEDVSGKFETFTLYHYFHINDSDVVAERLVAIGALATVENSNNTFVMLDCQRFISCLSRIGRIDAPHRFFEMYEAEVAAKILRGEVAGRLSRNRNEGT